MRSLLAASLAGALLVAGCSGGSGRAHKAEAKDSPCPLVAQLDQIAAQVGHTDVADPVAFERELGDAVTKYADTVRRLKAVVPTTLGPDLDRLEAAVHQYRFQDAAVARASLDEYAATECGRAIPTTVVTLPPTSAAPATTAP